MATSNNKVNPFYIAPNEKDEDDADSWGWEDDTDDLEELLGDGDTNQRVPQKGSKAIGRLPVQNLAYDSNTAGTSKLRYIVGGLLFVILIITVSSGGGAGEGPSDSLDQHDSVSGGAEGDTQPRIVVLGERHSGLPWLEKSLGECFPNATVSSSLQRAGYFFQDKPDAAHKKTHVVVVALNPYDWVDQMRRHPQYMPNHADMDDWKSFLRKDWTIERPRRDSVMEGVKGKVCQLGFTFDQVVSCVESPDDDPTTNPIYEMKPDGYPYESILELRAAKLRNHVEQVKKWVDTVTVVKYESLIKGSDIKTRDKDSAGIFDLLQTLAADVDLDWSCEMHAAPWVAPVGSHKLFSKDFVAYMNKKVDWEAEALIGYTRWDEDNIPGQELDDVTKDEDSAGGNGSTDPGVIYSDDDYVISPADDDYGTKPNDSGTSQPTSYAVGNPTEIIKQAETSQPSKSPAAASTESISPTSSGASGPTETIKHAGTSQPSIYPAAVPVETTSPTSTDADDDKSNDEGGAGDDADSSADDDNVDDEDANNGEDNAGDDDNSGGSKGTDDDAVENDEKTVDDDVDDNDQTGASNSTDDDNIDSDNAGEGGDNDHTSDSSERTDDDIVDNVDSTGEDDGVDNDHESDGSESTDDDNVDNDDNTSEDNGGDDDKPHSSESTDDDNVDNDDNTGEDHAGENDKPDGSESADDESAGDEDEADSIRGDDGEPASGGLERSGIDPPPSVTAKTETFTPSATPTVDSTPLRTTSTPSAGGKGDNEETPKKTKGPQSDKHADKIDEGDDHSTVKKGGEETKKRQDDKESSEVKRTDSKQPEGEEPDKDAEKREGEEPDEDTSKKTKKGKTKKKKKHDKDKNSDKPEALGEGGDESTSGNDEGGKKKGKHKKKDNHNSESGKEKNGGDKEKKNKHGKDDEAASDKKKKKHSDGGSI